MRSRVLAILMAGCFDLAGAEVTVDRAVALARAYFRDSAEVPMNVGVTTVVSDTAGKVKHRDQATVRLVFNGYNPRSGKGSLRANAGVLSKNEMYESLSGSFAAFMAAAWILPEKDSTHRFRLEAPEPGKPFAMVAKDADCAELQMMPRIPFPQHFCGSVRITWSEEAGGELAFQNIILESAGRPAAAKIAGLGDVRVLGFHAEVSFQKGFLQGDAKPFLWPKTAVTTVRTDRGTVEITNRYEAKNHDNP